MPMLVKKAKAPQKNPITQKSEIRLVNAEPHPTTLKRNAKNGRKSNDRTFTNDVCQDADIGYSAGMIQKLIVVTVVLLALGGCSTMSYYSQSVVGHSRLMLAREPVADVMVDAEPELLRLLTLSQELKIFATDELGLPDNDSYTTYVDLDREFPVWNVMAAPEFSVVAKHWCYPVIGCAAYRGYFKEESALEYARSLQKDGFETVVLGAAAYSTLGWFSDPIMPSMLRHGDVGFAETLFHELAHQKLYINGDSEFNEAFATVVGEVGASRWLAKHHPGKLPDYRARLMALDQFYRLLADSKGRLDTLFKQPISEADMREQKRREHDALHTRYQTLKSEHWQGKGWFDGWFQAPVNNARLAAFSTYRDKVSELRGLLALCGGRLTEFYATLMSLKLAGGVVTLPTHCDVGSE
jgi:predicted aminopeptidase